MYQRLLELISKLHDKKIMIIGDMVADVYLEGQISRISREAPVLVLEHYGEKIVPGGAANAVNNAADLGGKVYAVGIVGQDAYGAELVKVLADKSVNVDSIILSQERPTISKTRVTAGGQATVRQQVVRIDRESKAPLGLAIEQNLLQSLEAQMTQMDAVVMCDYGSGTITPAIRQKVISLCNCNGIPCMVDSRYAVLEYKGIAFVKQNEAEVAAALNLPFLNASNIVEAGHSLVERLAAKTVLITRGPDGMSLFSADGMVQHIPVSNVSEVYDVSGAGDTVVVTMMLAIAAGAEPYLAASLANYAAGIVVRKLGTATTNKVELKEAILAAHNQSDDR